MTAIALLVAVAASGGAPASSLQSAVTASMHGRSGTLVVADVVSGRILASERLDVAARRVVHPGSAVKPFTLMALLRRGVVAESTPYVCPGSLRLAGRRMDCVHGGLPRPLDAAAAVAYSCNNYFAHFGARLRDEDLTQAFAAAGFARPSGLARSEAAGRITAVTDADGVAMKAIGEAGIEVTPLEMLTAYRDLARRRLRGDSDPALAVTWRGMEQATEFGTAQEARVPGLSVAGKTGTSRATEGEWTHGWFVAAAPADRPRIALVVFLERGRGMDAAAIAGDVLRAYASGMHP